MQKYLLFLSSLELGGAEKQAINFAKYLLEHSEYVEIVSFSEEGKVFEICENENIVCKALDYQSNVFVDILLKMSSMCSRLIGVEFFPSWLPWCSALKRYIRQNDFMICVSYCAIANTVLGCMRKNNLTCKTVWFQRDAGIYDRGLLQKFAIHNVDYILANSLNGVEWIKKRFGMQAQLVYNGVERDAPQKSIDEWRKTINVDEDDVVCTMVANLHKAKDHMTLLKVWNILTKLNEGKKCKLVFAGRYDDMYIALKKYVEDNYLQEFVRFLGPVDDITGLLDASDICVFSAISEGSPNGIIEAELASLPVVATDLPEIEAVVSDENLPYLFERTDLGEAVKHILLLANDKNLRNYVGKRNKQYAELHFDSEKNFGELVRLIEKRG